jgi:DNA-binding transcriptional regulator YdaS (Cro superfamily)
LVVPPSSTEWPIWSEALILKTLVEVDWVVGGANGAAAKVGVKPTTLINKMKKVGICSPKRQHSMASAADMDSSEQNPAQVPPVRIM